MGTQINVEYVDKEGRRRFHEFRCHPHRTCQRPAQLSTANCATQAGQNKCSTADSVSQSRRIQVCHRSTSVCGVSELDESSSPVCSGSLLNSSLDYQAGDTLQRLQTDTDTGEDEQSSNSFCLNILWILLITLALYWLFSNHTTCNEGESALIEPDMLQLQNRNFDSGQAIVEVFQKCQDLRFSVLVLGLNRANCACIEHACNDFEAQRNTVTVGQKQKALLVDEVHMNFLKRTMVDKSPFAMAEKDFSSMKGGMSAMGSNGYLSIQLLAFKNPSEMFENMLAFMGNRDVIISLPSLGSSCKKLCWNLPASFIRKRNIHIREVFILPPPPNIEGSLATPSCIFSFVFPDTWFQWTCPMNLCSHTTKEIKVLNTDVTLLYSVLLCYY